VVSNVENCVIYWDYTGLRPHGGLWDGLLRHARNDSITTMPSLRGAIATWQSPSVEHRLLKMNTSVKNERYLSDWSPSDAAIDLIKLNGINDEQIHKSLEYLKNQNEIKDINDVDGYDNWNSFFIMFCIKANTSTAATTNDEPRKH
jgi:hypothetical protein